MKHMMVVALAAALAASFALAQGNDMGAAARFRMKTGRSLQAATQTSAMGAMASMKDCMKDGKMNAMASDQAATQATGAMSSMQGCMKGDKMSGMASNKAATQTTGAMSSMQGRMKDGKANAMAAGGTQPRSAQGAPMKHDHSAMAGSTASSDMKCSKDCCKQSD
jgi:hypothetical protein